MLMNIFVATLICIEANLFHLSMLNNVNKSFYETFLALPLINHSKSSTLLSIPNDYLDKFLTIIGKLLALYAANEPRSCENLVDNAYDYDASAQFLISLREAFEEAATLITFLRESHPEMDNPAFICENFRCLPTVAAEEKLLIVSNETFF
jgi:hypothetical protein